MTQERLQIVAERLTLEAVLELPEGASGPVPGIAVCHPHPQYGGDMDNDVVFTICRAARQIGIAALRFNFRGVGGSTGSYGGGYEEREDVWAALDCLRSGPEIDRGRLGLAGYSFGAAVALNAGIAAGVRCLAAVSPPPQLLDFSAQQGFEIPVLLIAGDRDPFVPPAKLEQLQLALGPQTECSVVPGADHFWYGHAAELDSALQAFFLRTLGL